ncbi:MAG: hypothetical protein GSR74_00600 [Desulfurococcales archaeon]|nr:hypothetical protein [Desulfurococcales archaeon]
MTWEARKDFRLIETSYGYLYILSMEPDPVFEIAVIASRIRPKVCGSTDLVSLRRRVVFYGLARYSEEDVVFEDKKASDKVKAFLRIHKIGKDRVYGFRQAHPNVSNRGYLCPGTIGRRDPAWPPEVLVKHLTSLLSLLSVPTFDSTLDSYGCKAYKALRMHLPARAERCLAGKCGGR